MLNKTEETQIHNKIDFIEKMTLLLPIFNSKIYIELYVNWRPSSLSELTPVIPKMERTHLGSETSNLTYVFYSLIYTLMINLSKI